MALLATLGILAYPQFWPVVVGVMVALLAGVIIVQIRPLSLWFIAQGEKLPFVSRFAQQLHALYESTYELLRLKNFAIGFAIGLLAWIAEGVALYLILIGLGVPDSPGLMGMSVFTLAVGSLVGGASSSPGGLGAAEASMTGILHAVVGLSYNLAATATLMIRFFTLWLGVGLGILVVLIWRKTLFGYDEPQQPAEAIETGLGYDSTV